MHGFRWLIAVSLLTVLPAQGAFAATGDAANGKRIFMQKGNADKACMTCHPRGETIGYMPSGKEIPSLTAEELSSRKLRSKTNRFVKRMKLELTDKEYEDLYAFVEQLPSQGFGTVPAEWQAYVNTKLKK